MSENVMTAPAGRRPTIALWLSAIAVLAGAVGFDVLADERPVHTLGVAFAAVIVGAGRIRMHDRFRGVTTAMSLTIVAQPLVHALSKVSHPHALVAPHSHDLPADVSSLALHTVVAVLVVAIAASRPACLLLAGVLVRALHHLLVLVRRLPGPGPELPRTVRRDHDEPPPRRRRRTCLPAVSRRGPPRGRLAA